MKSNYFFTSVKFNVTHGLSLTCNMPPIHYAGDWHLLHPDLHGFNDGLGDNNNTCTVPLTIKAFCKQFPSDACNRRFISFSVTLKPKHDFYVPQFQTNCFYLITRMAQHNTKHNLLDNDWMCPYFVPSIYCFQIYLHMLYCV